MIINARFWIRSMSSDKKKFACYNATLGKHTQVSVTVMYTTIKVFVSALDRFSNLSIYSRLLDFLTILSTCRFHIKLFWTTRPKIFSDSTSLIGLPDTVRGWKYLLSLARFQVCFSRAVVREAEHLSTHA
jgi:hypothetical protein